MNKLLKVTAVLLTATIITSLSLNAVQAKPNEVKVGQVKFHISDPIVNYVSGPIVDGTEDIIAQETIVQYGTIKGPESLVALVIGACVQPGISAIKSAAARYIANTVTAGVLGKIINGTQVKMVMNRYIVRCADGTEVFRVYVTYYDMYGNFIDAKLAQEGRYQYPN